MSAEIHKLFAGPFVGEFGWELFCWQGHIRYLAQNKYQKTIVACRKGLSFLYEDFADEVIEHELDSYNPDGERNFGKNGNVPLPPDNTYRYIKPGTPHIPRYFPNTGLFNTQYPQVFHKYKNEDPDLQTFDFIIHARSRTQTGNHPSVVRNFSEQNWNIVLKPFLDSGYTFGSIGSLADSYHIEGTQDLRGLPLDKVCAYLCKCKALIGPSSGPMHFGALCGTPLVVWSGTPNNKMRYETKWNPFNVDVKYIFGWRNARPTDIIKNIRSFT